MDLPVSSLESLVSLEVAKLFWNASFKHEDLHLNKISLDTERTWEIKLTEFREKAICYLNTFIQNRKLPRIFKSYLTECMFKLHEAYYELLLWKITYDPYNKINAFEEGKLYAPNYFTLDGEFNDEIWAKRFVLDTNYPRADRFNMGCSYWFENECAELWLELNFDNMTGYNFIYCDSFYRNWAIVSYMILHIEQPSITPEGTEWRTENCFWRKVFYHAIEMGYESAILCSWFKMSGHERLNILEDDSVFEFLSKGTKTSNGLICYFLFDLLSRERKLDFYLWSIDNHRLEVWHTLLVSPHAQNDFAEILDFYTHLPLEMYADLLQLLAHRIKQHKYPSDSIVFSTLWSILDPIEKYYMLYNNSLILETLVKAKSLRILSPIIKSLTPKLKEECLLNNRYGGGINILNILSKEGELDLFLRYLSFFLIENDSGYNPDEPGYNEYDQRYGRYPPGYNKYDYLRKDAVSFIRKFLASSDFKTWCINEASIEKQREVTDRIQEFQISLIVLDDICKKVCADVCVSRSLSRINVTKSEEIEQSPSSSRKRKFEAEKICGKLKKCVLK